MWEKVYSVNLIALLVALGAILLLVAVLVPLSRLDFVGFLITYLVTTLLLLAFLLTRARRTQRKRKY